MSINKLMINICTVILFISLFLLGWYVHTLTLNIGGINLEAPLSSGFFVAPERPSPADHILESQIQVTSDKVTLNIPDVQWGSLADTNSMVPVMDKGAYTLQILPNNVSEIKVGDIVIYTPTKQNIRIIHRVVQIGNDSMGWFCVTKGDNLSDPDPGKIRFSQISGLLVGIIY